MDIAYNGLACPHGYVYEGRGPGHRSAANGTNTGNDTSAVICYIGGEGDPFTPEGQQAMNDGAAWLGDAMQKGHRDWYNTACPGDVIYGWIHSGAPSPGPTPPPQQEDDDLPLHVVIGHPNTDGGKWWLTDWVHKWWIPSADCAAQIIVSTIATGGKIEKGPNNGPVQYDQRTVDAVPVAK
jgi:hypothetical protein